MANRILSFKRHKRTKQTRKQFWIPKVLQFPVRPGSSPDCPPEATADFCPNHDGNKHCYHSHPRTEDLQRCCQCGQFYIEAELYDFMFSRDSEEPINSVLDEYYGK